MWGGGQIGPRKGASATVVPTKFQCPSWVQSAFMAQCGLVPAVELYSWHRPKLMDDNLGNKCSLTPRRPQHGSYFGRAASPGRKLHQIWLLLAIKEKIGSSGQGHPKTCWPVQMACQMLCPLWADTSTTAAF